MPTRRPASWAVVLTAVAVLAACDAGPVVTGPPAVANPTPAPSAGSPEPSETPFSPASWPASGSACGTEGYTRQPRADRGHRGAHGGVHAVRARRRVPVPRRAPGPGHPRRGDDRRAGDEPRQRALAGRHRPVPDRPLDARARTSGSSGPATRPRPTPRSRRSSSPGPTTRPSAPSACSRRPSTGSTPPGRPTSTGSRRCPSSPSTRATGSRPPTWGSGPAPAWARSPSGARIAGALDRDTLATDGFAAGSSAATHVTPCEIDGGCGGTDWYGFNAPAASAALAAAKFDLGQTYMLHIPDRPVPGLPDPAGLAKAVAAQLETNIGLHTEIDTMPVPRSTRPISRRASSTGCSSAGSPRASRIRAPSSSPCSARTCARPRPTGRRRPRRRDRGGGRDAGPRRARRRRSAAPTTPSATPRALVPLAHPGSVAAFRADVTDVVTSPLGLDPLGGFTPGRPQPARVHAGERARRRLLRRPGRRSTPTGCAASSWRACTASSRGR